MTGDDGRYPQGISPEFVTDKISLLDDLQNAQEVTVSFDIRGREYNGRYFDNPQGWKAVSADSETNEKEPPPLKRRCRCSIFR